MKQRYQGFPNPSWLCLLGLHRWGASRITTKHDQCASCGRSRWKRLPLVNNEALARAWDEGEVAGGLNAQSYLENGLEDEPIENPYRGKTVGRGA